MKKLGIMIAIAMIAATAVRAETLVLWELDDLAASQATASADTVHSNMSSTALTAGAGLATGIGWPNALGGLADWNLTPNLENAILNDDYFSFTLTTDAGKKVSCSNLFSRVAVNNPDGSADVTFFILSDRTGFTKNDALDSFNVTNAAVQSASTIFTNNFNLSTVSELQSAQGAIEFRIYVSATGGNRMAIGHDNFANGTDDLRVDGIVEEATSLPVVELALWNLDGLAANSKTATVDTVHADMSSSDLVSGAGILITDGGTGVGWPHSLAGYAHWALPPSLEYAIQTGNNYYSFTLTPDSGSKVGYDNLFATFSANTGGGTNDITYYLLASQTGFSTNAILGSFRINDNVPNYSPSVYTHEFDLSAFPELKDLAEPTEFRIYATSVWGNRMGIGLGHASADGADDLRVEGTIEELGYVPATIVSWTSVSDSVMKLVIDVPADPALYYPKATTDLVSGTWAGVPHSNTDAGPFDTITNLSYSATEGGNKAIFVETTETAKFFGIGEE